MPTLSAPPQVYSFNRESVITDLWLWRPLAMGGASGVEYTYGTPMSVLPSFAERKRVWVFRRCTLSEIILMIQPVSRQQ